MCFDVQCTAIGWSDEFLANSDHPREDMAALQTDCPKFSVFPSMCLHENRNKNHGDISCGLDERYGGYTVPGSEGPRVYFIHLV